jgi:SnoaL-like protein
MQENADEPFVGKAVNRKRQEEFFGSVQEFHSATLLASAVNGDTTFAEWELDATYKGGTGVSKMAEVAVRHWENGQIVQEHFYYNKG